MTTTDHVRDLVSVITHNDPDDVRIERSIEALGPKKASLVIAATFELAVPERFPGAVDLHAVRDFVSAARERLSSIEKAPRFAAEGMIRSVLEDEEFAREIPTDLVLPTEVWLTYALIKDLYPDGSGLPKFLDKAVGLAKDWISEGRGE